MSGINAIKLYNLQKLKANTRQKPVNAWMGKHDQSQKREGEKLDIWWWGNEIKYSEEW